VDIFESEVLAIVGDNGAGKSTLTKILSGVLQPDRGDLYIRQQKVRIGNARKAHDLGVATVFQNLALVNCRDVACNLFLGREPTVARIFVDRKKMMREARTALAELGVNIPSLAVEAGDLSVASGSASPSRAPLLSTAGSSSWTSRPRHWRKGVGARFGIDSSVAGCRPRRSSYQP